MNQVRSKALILALLSTAQLMIVLDFSIVNVALPSIQEQFQISSTDLQWIISAYALTFGGFLLLGGRATDLFRRKRIFLFGLVLFSAASLLGGFAPSSTIIILARGAQGLGAAMLQPSALSLLTTSYLEGSERNRALSIFSSMAAIGFTIGVILGGILTSYLSWHWVFFVNVPMGVVVFVGAYLFFPRSEAAKDVRSSDLQGAIWGTATLVVLVLAITRFAVLGEGAVQGIVLLIVAALLAYLFVRHERRASNPLIPIDIFSNRTLVAAIAIMFLLFAANVAQPFIISLYLQIVRGLSPLETGLVFIPAGLGGITGAFIAPRLVERIGVPRTMVIGPFLFAVGLLTLTFITPSVSLSLIMVGYLFAGLGLVIAIVSTTIAAVSGVKAQRQGLTAGLLNTSQQMGAAIGVSVASVVAATVTRDFGGGSMAVITDGYRAALLVAFGLVVIALIIAWRRARSLKRGDSTTSELVIAEDWRKRP